MNASVLTFFKVWFGFFFFKKQRFHTGSWGKSQLGKSQTMCFIFLPTQPFSKQRINPGVPMVV